MPKPLLLQTQEALRRLHYSIRTEKSYLRWIKRFILFHNKRHPLTMGQHEIEAFLTYLAVDCNVAAATQNQALAAILFLYRVVLEQELDFPIHAARAKRPKRLPTVLTQSEARSLLACLEGTHQLMARLLYGSGLRSLECLRLRVKDLDFTQHALIVRDGKGAKDRITVLPDSLLQPLQTHLHRIKRLHERDLARGLGAVHLPTALERKYPPRSPRMGLAMGFPLPQAVGRSPLGRHAAAPSQPLQPSKSRPPRRRPGRHPQARHLPHSAPFLRHPPARRRLRHPHRSGPAWP